jgi:hypothetical protein
VRTTLFWNDIHQVHSRSKYLKPNNLKVFGSKIQKVLNRIAKIGRGHLCLSEGNLSFSNKSISITKLYLIYHVNAETLTTEWMKFQYMYFNVSLFTIIWSRLVSGNRCFDLLSESNQSFRLFSSPSMQH